MDLKTYVKDQGFAVPSEEMYKEIAVWEDYYKGKETKYNIYNGNSFTSKTRKALRMAKKLCEDKADLLMNEKVDINMSDSDAEKTVNKVLIENQFFVEANGLVEMSSALGTAAVLIYIENDETKLDYLTINDFVPCINEDGEIYKIFTGYKVCDTHFQIYSYETLSDGTTLVEDYLIDVKSKNKVTITTDAGEEIYQEDTILPFVAFHILRPNVKNNIDLKSPLGISIYANALDVLDSTDIIFDSYLNEFILGKKRIFVKDDLLKVDLQGSTKVTFDPNDVVFYAMDLDEGDPSIKEVNMTLRTAEHSQGLKETLAMLGSKCGFGNHYYSFEGGTVKTATEVISENSEMYRKIRKDEILLDDWLKRISINILKAEEFKIKDNLSITIDFDDTIIEDTTARRQQYQLEYNMGIIDRVTYFQLVYNMSEAEAIEKDKLLTDRKPKEETVPYGFDG